MWITLATDEDQIEMRFLIWINNSGRAIDCAVLYPQSPNEHWMSAGSSDDSARIDRAIDCRAGSCTTYAREQAVKPHPLHLARLCARSRRSVLKAQHHPR
ncbi:hypothetical protein DNTS_018034 [Danionella cerebrum]|uniref:Uncharacterized protein n=1 Tax=Danionella cerebrum TaxID=2873325 RepID=A0A553NKD0_9TELE|nr:hypothetical protein DNTS_018034 [Danionella translucida]